MGLELDTQTSAVSPDFQADFPKPSKEATVTKSYLPTSGLTPTTLEPACPERFELLREIVPTTPLTSDIILRADRDHIDRIELGKFAGERFLISKTRFGE